MRRALSLAETLLACALAALALWGLAWLAFRISDCRWHGVGPAEPWARRAVPASEFPWAEWAAYLVAFIAVPLAWESWRGHRPRSQEYASSAARALGFVVPKPWARETAMAVGLSVVVLGYVAAAAACAHLRLPRALASGNAAFYAVNWAVYAVAEETLFRGFVQRRLAQALPLWPAIIVAAAIWALVGHWRAPPVENLCLRLPVGIALGWLFARSGSLLPPIAAHWLINLGVTAGL